MKARAGRTRRSGRVQRDSDAAERRPVGEELVDRTAREGIGTDLTDPLFIAQRAGQLPISYAGSPVVTSAPASATVGLQPGSRAPDRAG